MTTPAQAPELAAVRLNRATREVLSTEVAPSSLGPAVLGVLATVPRWWRRRAIAAGLDAPWSDVQTALIGWPPVDVEVPWRRDLLDATAHAVGEAYVLALGATVRSQTGRHYTPDALSTALWQRVKSHSLKPFSGLTLDPACGAGSLLLPVLRDWLRHVEGMAPEQILADAQDVISGTDLDPIGVAVGNVLLAAELLPTLARVPEFRRKPLPSLLSVADGLGIPEKKAQNIVLNPPYGRVRLSDNDRAKWKDILAGHANRYYLHVAAATKQVEDGGVIAALIPAGWLGGAYARNLRSYLSTSAPLSRLTYVRDRIGVFSTDVTQETVIATFNVGSEGNAVECDRIQLTEDACVSESIGTAPGLDGQRPLLLPRSPKDTGILAKSLKMRSRLRTYGWTVSTGPLVWNRHKEQLSSHPRLNSVAVVWAADIDGGCLHRDQRRSEMRYAQVSERQRRTLVLDRPAVLVQRTTSPEQLRRVVAASITEKDLVAWGGEIIVENHVNVLTCSESSSDLSPRVLAALLDSNALDRLYRCLSGSVAVSAYELQELPFPDGEALRKLEDLWGGALTEAIEALYG